MRGCAFSTDKRKVEMIRLAVAVIAVIALSASLVLAQGAGVCRIFAF
jgi:hypothetical protein